MNRYQNIVVIVAAANLLLMLLFPPFLDNPMARGVPRSFESFYFVFMAPTGALIYKELLTIEVIFVVANALVAWLVLNGKNGHDLNLSDAAVARGLILFGLVNFGLIGLFPPFQPYPSMFLRMPAEGFDGFYFAFGDKRHRGVFLPMLYLEVILIAVNLLLTWLLFGLLRRSLSAADRQLIEAIHHIPAREAEAIIHGIQEDADYHLHSAEHAHPSGEHDTDGQHHELGRKEDRRHHQDPNYHGPERRTGHDRRHHHE